MGRTVRYAGATWLTSDPDQYLARRRENGQIGRHSGSRICTVGTDTFIVFECKAVLVREELLQLSTLHYLRQCKYKVVT